MCVYVCGYPEASFFSSSLSCVQKGELATFLQTRGTKQSKRGKSGIGNREDKKGGQRGEKHRGKGDRVAREARKEARDRQTMNDRQERLRRKDVR
jgi:hypothetical protein